MRISVRVIALDLLLKPRLELGQMPIAFVRFKRGSIVAGVVTWIHFPLKSAILHVFTIDTRYQFPVTNRY